MSIVSNEVNSSMDSNKTLQNVPTYFKHVSYTNLYRFQRASQGMRYMLILQYIYYLQNEI